MEYSIHKAAAILIKDKKLLVEKSFGKEFFVAPGGKLEKGETSEEALVRELKEELTIDVAVADLEFFETNYAEAANHPGQKVRMDTFIVKNWRGTIKKANEVEALAWVDSEFGDRKVGSIFAHETIPKLKSQGLIN